MAVSCSMKCLLYQPVAPIWPAGASFRWPKPDRRLRSLEHRSLPQPAGQPDNEASDTNAHRRLCHHRQLRDRRSGRPQSDRSTGCACRGSTAAPVSRPCSARPSTALADRTGPERASVTRRIAAHADSRDHVREREGAVSIVDFMSRREGVSDVVRIVKGLRGTVPMHTEIWSSGSTTAAVVPWVSRQTRPASIHAVRIDWCSIRPWRCAERTCAPSANLTSAPARRSVSR